MDAMTEELARKAAKLADRLGKMERLERVRLSSQVSSGTWTPTLINTTNVTSSTAYEGLYTKIGNIVQCVVAVSITPTATGAVELRLVMPIVPANFANIYGASGVGAVSDEVLSGSIASVTSGTRLALKFIAPSTSTRVWRLVFSYKLS